MRHNNVYGSRCYVIKMSTKVFGAYFIHSAVKFAYFNVNEGHLTMHHANTMLYKFVNIILIVHTVWKVTKSRNVFKILKCHMSTI